MIVKILSSSGTFAGVNYNKDKVEKGTAELMAAENFGMLQMSRTGIGDAYYKRYLRSWSKSGDGVQLVKQPQFHAVISCEGREKDAYELQDIAQQYLEKMGYAENPYLIYFHADTPHNHIHIVSSRVDGEGRKIDDSFERTRSQKAIKEILRQDMGEEVRAHVRQAMGYNFSAPAQFLLLLEGQGVKAEDDGIAYNFIKYGRLISALDKGEVAAKAAACQAPEARARQLKSVFAKYRPGLSLQEFKDLLQSKFGVELVLHQARGKGTPYGYTIIDHAKKQVLKGSQVMKLSELLSPAGQVTAEQRHMQRMERASQWTVTSAADARILERVFFLKAGTLKVNSQKDEGSREYAADRLNSMLGNGRVLDDILRSNGWSIVSASGQHYLVDRREKAIHPMNELTYCRPDYGTASVLDLDRKLSPPVSRQLECSSGSIIEMLQLIAEGLQEGSRTVEQERKNKRRMKR